jgi:hypothetical protein
MTEFALNRKQVGQLAQLADHFQEVEWFTLQEESTSGIGSAITVKFKLFDDADKDTDTTVNITDVSTW